MEQLQSGLGIRHETTDEPAGNADPATGAAVRALLVEAVVKAEGVTERQLAEIARQLEVPRGTDIDAILETLLVLNVLERRDQRVVPTHLTDTFLKGMQIAVAG